MKFINESIKYGIIDSLELPDEIRDELLVLSEDQIPFLIPYRNSSKFFRYNTILPLIDANLYYDQDFYTANFEDKTISKGNLAPIFGMSFLHIEGIEDSETGRLAFRNTSRYFDSWTIKEQYKNTKLIDFVFNKLPMSNIIGIRFHKVSKGSFAQYHTDNWPNYLSHGIMNDENAHSEIWNIHGYTQLTFMFSRNGTQEGNVVVFNDDGEGFVLDEKEVGKKAFTFDDRLVHGVKQVNDDIFVLRITGKLK